MASGDESSSTDSQAGQGQGGAGGKKKKKRNRTSPAAIAAAAASAAVTKMINSSVPFPEPLSLSGNVRQNVDDFIEGFEIYMIASGLENQEDRVQVATFKAALGLEARKIFKNWPLLPADTETVAGCLAVLKKNMAPQRNVKLARYEFLQCKQQEACGGSDGESMSQFINRARALVKDCNWGNMEEEMLRDIIVAGLSDLRLKKSFIDKPELTAAQVIDQCMSEEATRKELEKNKWMEEKHAVNKVFKKKSKICSYCGNEYHKSISECPAQGCECRYCKQRNHFEVMCWKKREDDKRKKSEKQSKKNKSGRKKVHTIDEENSEESSVAEEDLDEEVVDSIEFLYSVEQDHAGLLKANLTFRDGDSTPKKVKCILDTGATCNVVGLPSLLEILNVDQIPLDNNRVVLRGFGGSSIKTIGRATVDVQHNGKPYKAVFNVVRFPQMPILSKHTCLKLELVKLCLTIAEQETEARNIVSRFSSVFQGIGKLEGDVHLEVDPSIKPVVQPARRIPVTLREELKKQLGEMEKLQIVARVDEPTDWVSNLVLVKRNGKIRICIDPILLNTALKRPHYPIPTINELLPELANAKIFTTVDAKSGFWQVGLDDESSKLTTFWTPFGRYCWKRMPFGISPAPEIFQQKLHGAVHGLKGVRALADDVLIFGSGESTEEAMIDHNRNLQAFLERMAAKNVKLNKDKIRLCQPTVKFFGHLLTPDGVKPDHDKIRSITEMEDPKDEAALLRFLGMVTYLSSYLPKLSTVAEPLRRLTKKNEPWSWGTEHRKAFAELKKLVTEAPVLKYFNAKNEVVIQCDSSSVGLGAVLLQGGLPVCYASKALSPTEQRYAQIEKETLAILYACRKFEFYIIGKKALVQTDHQPLLRIFKRPLTEIPMRLQRMILALQRYKVTLQFKPGKEVVIADMLSRAALAEGDNTSPDIYDIYTMDMDFSFSDLEQVDSNDYIPIADERLDQIRAASSEDGSIQWIIRAIVEGWPNSPDEVPDPVRAFWNTRADLSTRDGIVYRNDRILVPAGMRAGILKRLHASHSGIEATTKLARDTVFWPGITRDIKECIQNCDICIKHSPNQQNQPMQTHQIPSYPFQKVSMDLCEAQVAGKKHVYLITVDHFSDFIEVDELNRDATAGTVVQKCRENFARYGTPMYVTTDGGPQFNSDEFCQFAEQWEFKHSMSAPYHQQGNGKAEAAVKIVKKLLKKSLDTKSDFWQSLQQWRNVPNSCGSSPAQRVFCRRTRFNIPMAEAKFEPKVQEGVKEQIKKNRQRAKSYYDRTAKTLPGLEVGQPVFVKKKPTDNAWTKGTVESAFNDRSTIVDVQGQKYRRDNVLIKPAGTSRLSVPTTQPEEQPAERPKEEESSSPGRTPVGDPAAPVAQERPQRSIRQPEWFKDYQMY